jgi:exopolysaccharide production protein ExoZ
MDRFISIQVLRGFAAMMVVAYHAIDMANERFALGWRFGAAGEAGVDVFFVISGFVMIVAAQKTGAQDAHRFLLKRFIRIYPLYWFWTTVKLVLLLTIPAAAVSSVLDPAHLAASYALLPWTNADGKIYPFLVVGWTLSYEIFFYLCMAAALALRLPIRRTVTLLFLVLIAVGTLPHNGWPALAIAFTHPILLEFVFGMYVAHLVTSGRLIARNLAPAVVMLSFVLLIAGVLLVEEYLPWRTLLFGVPGLLMVWGVASLEAPIAARAPRLLQHLGDASYSIYLAHTLWISALGTVLARLHLPPSDLITYAMLAVAVVGSAVIGSISYVLLEKPTIAWLGRLSKR